MLLKKTKTTETYILPEEFEKYNNRGYVIFMSKPTMFGTYRAIKIEVTDPSPNTIGKEDLVKITLKKPINTIVKFWNILQP